MMKTFRISPRGSDDRPRGPWATLSGARDALRRLRARGEVSGPVTVLLAPGRYPLSEPVEFTYEDSHTTYAAARPGTAVVDGGGELVGWREETCNGRRAWILDLQEVASRLRYFRSLFVDGIRRPRARLPKFSPDAQGVENVFRIGTLRHPEKRKLFDGDNVFQPVPGDVQPWPSLPDAEVVLLHYWVETRLGAPRLDPDTGWVTTSRRSVFNLYESFNPKLARYYIDNLQEALTDPGEWYLERSTGRLTYLPLDHERLGKTRLVAPRVHAFIRASGTTFNRDQTTLDVGGLRPLRGFRLEGMVFRHSDWFQAGAETLPHDRQRVEDIPLGGSVQAASDVPAVIEFSWARDCGVENCTIERVGFTGIEFDRGCRDCWALGNTLREVGGSGVKVGGSEVDGPSGDWTGHVRIEDNTITDIGRVFHQAVGVLLTHAFSCSVAHNEIARTCYTGISCGWSWGFRDTISGRNRIENNSIHDIGQGVLSDMGAIYILGVQPGTIIRGNHIHSVSSADYGGWGIYPDEGSAHLVIEHNWVHDTQGSSLRIHVGRELVVRDNVFARSAKEGLVGIGRPEAIRAATLLNNVFLGPAPGVFEGGYAGELRDAFRSDANLIWFQGQEPVCANAEYRTDVPARLSWKEWCAAGNDRRSLLADPRIREASNQVSFPKNSAVHEIGFRPYDWSQCGPRPGRRAAPSPEAL